MRSKDKKLGMDKPIARRDFLNGVGLTIGASLMPKALSNPAYSKELPVDYYPPARGCMRGSHVGSFEVAHEARDGKEWEAKPINEHYDLVIVGAGISGLSAAYIYTRDIDSKAKILILDNHDDFGGHAKRNEITVEGKMLIGFGGTQLMEAPKTYPQVVKEVVAELGINKVDDSEISHQKNFRDLGMKQGYFFDEETFGKDCLITGNLFSEDSLKKMPLSEKAKGELVRLYENKQDYLSGMSDDERREILESISWREYLAKYANIGKEVLAFIQKRSHGVWAIGADGMPAWMALKEGYPGFADMDLGYKDHNFNDEDLTYFRFPDGNASIARLLVRKLIPGIAPGNTMEDIVTARFDYSKLDKEQSRVKIRLNSSVIKLAHKNKNSTGKVEVTYVNDDKARTVTGDKVIWAGYHAMLPYICDEIPDDQFEGFQASVRSPLVYTTVAIKNWHSLVKLGVNGLYCPGSFFQTLRPTHAISIGDYEYAKSPDEPILLHLQHIPTVAGEEPQVQFRAGRQFLLDTPFETFERNVRDQLGRIFGPGGFDPARDIAGITVNRWPHGYAYSVNMESGDVAWGPNLWHHDYKPWEVARKSIGNIAFAGSDAASNGMTEAAIEEAHRAVHSFK